MTEERSEYTVTPTLPVTPAVTPAPELADWERRLLNAARLIRAKSHQDRKPANMLVTWDGPAQRISVVKPVDEHRGN